MLDIKLETLLTVNEKKSFTKAAEELSLTQPAVSHHIAMLEEDLKIKIFHRPIVSITEMMMTLRVSFMSTLCCIRFCTPTLAIVPNSSSMMPPSTACGIDCSSALSLPMIEKQMAVAAEMRITAGDVSLRKYFGAMAAEKPLQGHHIGINAQMLTYDIEFGGKGYMGGKPGGTLWDRMNYTVGAEYGYSMPVARRLNIDFSLAAGYMGGRYYEYTPLDGHYVWQATKNRKWIGPTKVEVSLVWLLGHGNYNTKTKKGVSE